MNAPLPITQADALHIASLADSARMCTLLRYDRDIDSHDQHDDDCECVCHQWIDDDDYLG